MHTVSFAAFDSLILSDKKGFISAVEYRRVELNALAVVALLAHFLNSLWVYCNV